MKALTVAALLSGDLRANLCFVLATAAHAIVFSFDPHPPVHRPFATPREQAMLLELAPSVVSVQASTLVTWSLDESPRGSLQQPARVDERTSERRGRKANAATREHAVVAREPTALPETQTSDEPSASNQGVTEATETVQPGAPNATVRESGNATGAVTGPGGAPHAVGKGLNGVAQGARLLSAGDPCAGYFPAASPVSKGSVKVRVDVDARGMVTGSAVLLVTPPGSGLFQAAVACASRLRFVAATTREGHAVASQATLSLKFERH